MNFIVKNILLKGKCMNIRLIRMIKQGLVQDYSQRIEGANIFRQKLSRLKLSRLRPYRHRLPRLRPHRLGPNRLRPYRLIWV